MNKLKDFANNTVIKNLELEYKQYMELIPRLLVADAFTVEWLKIEGYDE